MIMVCFCDCFFILHISVAFLVVGSVNVGYYTGTEPVFNDVITLIDQYIIIVGPVFDELLSNFVTLINLF